MKNKFNNLSSKEWLPFQKSWFRFVSTEKLYEENLLFFTKTDEAIQSIYYYGDNESIASRICSTNRLKLTTKIEDPIQFALLDLRHEITADTNVEQYEIVKQRIIDKLCNLFKYLDFRRFITILIPNIQHEFSYFPYAWDLAKAVSSIFSIKDEKVACLPDELGSVNNTFFEPNTKHFYCLYFRKDDNSKGIYTDTPKLYFLNNIQRKSSVTFNNLINSWFILKPQARKKEEILHPAKYPEELVELFVKSFTKEGDNVFDPMSGTGSSQIGALRLKRNGYGTELSEFFARIATTRCQEYLEPSQMALFSEPKSQKFKIINKDARLLDKDDFPLLDYCITSPPYWDMLNMKGAENQAKRIELGLKTNYSDDQEDLGNVADYNEFLNNLTSIYFNIADHMKPGGYFTIIVKNIKKSGQNYPFAWDLSNLLQERLILLPEVFWLQDDISIAPYGYGNTWVSNTFHQYCLNFQKPL